VRHDVRTDIRNCRGFSIVEVLVSITLGLAVMAGLVSVFVNSSNATRELHRSSQQIENGRYAMDTLLDDVHHAGFYGMWFRIGPPLADPDPCALTDAGGELSSALPFAVQAYDAADFATRVDLSSTTCDAWLTPANLVPGSDVFVVRRSDTNVLVPGATAVSNEVYLQANATDAEVQFGSGTPLAVDARADGTPAIVRARGGLNGAEVRKLRVHVYFVAPCSVPAGGGDLCTGAGDDGGTPIPSLKRLELTSLAGVTTMRTEAVAEGIDSLQVDFGIDDLPAAVDLTTGLRGDGVPDRYVRAPLVAEYADAVTVRFHVLARNAEATQGYVDVKSFPLGLSGTLAARNDEFKRHAYSGLARLTNVGGRKEIPQ
jgi:type IV pilus assembly protein PilW